MKHLLMKAKQEIIDLRRRNELLSAQISVVEVFAAALGLRRESGGMGIDVAWELQCEIDTITEQEAQVPRAPIENDQRF